MGKLLAPLWNAANKLITRRFQYTPGIEAAPVVDRRNATMYIVDKISGFSMPIFKVVMERGAHAFKVHEKEQLCGVSLQTSRSYWRRHVHPAGTSLCSGARAVVVALVSFLVWTGSSCFAGIEPFSCPPAKGHFPSFCGLSQDMRSRRLFSSRLLGDFVFMSCSRGGQISLLVWVAVFVKTIFAVPAMFFHSPDVLQSTRRFTFLRSSSLHSQETASLTCRHIPAKVLRLCT